MASTRPVTFKQIASALDLSVTTVSLVLNGKGAEARVSPETRARVIEKAEELGYVPRSGPDVSPDLPRGTVPRISIFWAADGDGGGSLERFFKYISSHSEGAFEFTFHLFFGHELSKYKSKISRVYCDGIIMCGMQDDDMAFLESETWDVPIVLYNRSSTKFPSIVTDSYNAGKMVAEHFIRRGHRRFALILPPNVEKEYSIMRSGFVDTCQSGGLDDGCVCASTGAMDSEGGQTAMDSMLDSGAKPTAVMCFDDNMVAGVYRSLVKHGRLIPRDVEVIACGDHSWNSYLLPTVTSLRPPVSGMAKDCLETLLNMVGNPPDTRAFFIYHNSTLKFRESCPEHGHFQAAEEIVL